MAEIDIDREAARISEQVEQARERAEDRFSRAGPVDGYAEAPDGAIAVEVSPGGMLTNVRISPAALRGGPDAIAQQIMELAERATRRAADAMYRTLAPALGPDADVQLASLGYQPMPDDDDDESYQRVVR